MGQDIEVEELIEEEPYEEEQAVEAVAEPAATEVDKKEEDWMSDYEGALNIDMYQTKDNVIIKSTIAGVRPEDITGVEISPDQVVMAHERIPAATFVVGDISDASLLTEKSGTFDVVFSHMVFEHLSDEQLEQVLHGSGFSEARFSQLTALAKSRASVVLPTPRGPVNKRAWGSRPLRRALSNVWLTCCCPMRSTNV